MDVTLLYLTSKTTDIGRVDEENREAVDSHGFKTGSPNLLQIWLRIKWPDHFIYGSKRLAKRIYIKGQCQGYKYPHPLIHHKQWPSHRSPNQDT
jgi:hypothetical protein